MTANVTENALSAYLFYAARPVARAGFVMRWVILVSLIFFVAATLPAPSANTPAKPLTNADIVALVKAGLSDGAIVAAIAKSPHDFDTGAPALIALKQAGVNNTIIEAMIGAPATDSADPTAPASAGQVPSTFGYFVVEGTALIHLPETEIVTKFGWTLGDRGCAVDGLPAEPLVTITNDTPTIIVYQQNPAVDSLRLSSLSYVPSMKAVEFNILNTDLRVFESSYHKKPSDVIPIEMWRPSRSVEIRVKPVDAKPGMYKLIPAAPLEAGRYALYATGSLHQRDHVFTASPGRTGVALYFGIAGEPPVDPPQPRSLTERKRHAEKALDRAYRDLRARADPAGKKRLAAEILAFIRERKQFGQDTEESVDMTEKKAKELQARLESK